MRTRSPGETPSIRIRKNPLSSVISLCCAVSPEALTVAPATGFLVVASCTVPLSFVTLFCAAAPEPERNQRQTEHTSVLIISFTPHLQNQCVSGRSDRLIDLEVSIFRNRKPNRIPLCS